MPGISGVDTRALVRHIRDAGAMRGGIFSAATPQAEALERVRAEPSMVGRDLAREVTVREPEVRGDGAGPRIIALDTGIKRSIIRNFTSRGAVLELYPCTTPASELLERDPDGFFLVPGPGDPAALDYIVETIRELLSTKPVFGICLGHQLLSRAAGLETFKLPFGHRGANHPVKDLRTGRIAITSQNHGFAVRGEVGVRIESALGAAELTHVNLYDGTVEGDPACSTCRPAASSTTRRLARVRTTRSGSSTSSSTCSRGPARKCRAATTSRRSSCSARARS